MITIIPGINEREFDPIKRNLEQVEGLADWVEIDVLDNTLYPFVTYNNFEAYGLFTHTFHLSAHLMVSDPLKYVERLYRVGFKRLIADVEGDTVREFLDETKSLGLEVGVALNGPSPLDLIEPFLDQIDTVLLLGVAAGASGQPIMPDVYAKIKKIHDSYPDLPIEVDGGVDMKTAPLLIQNGATRLLTTSYLFTKNRDRIAEAIEELKSL